MGRIVRPHIKQPTYIGPVCTRCRIPQNGATGGPYTFTKRTYHYARDNITWLKFGFPNWYCFEDTGETATAALTVAASIEYPFTVATTGTVAKVATWGGATTFLAPGGVTSWSDWMYCPIPMGARFGSRFFLSVVTTSPYNDPATYAGSWRDAAGGDVLQFSVNATAGGAMTDDGSQIDFTPIIIGHTRRPTIALIGDSIQSGWHDTVDANAGDAGETARTYGKSLGYINIAVGGDTLASFVATNGAASPLRRALAKFCSHVAVNMGINDVSAGVAAATVQANIAALLGLPGVAGKPVIYSLMTPESTSTDTFATTANQTTQTWNGVRNTVNTWLAAGSASKGGINDPRTAVENPTIPTGIWKAPGLTSDGTHPTQAGYQAIMNGGCVDPRKIVLRS